MNPAIPTQTASAPTDTHSVPTKSKIGLDQFRERADVLFDRAFDALCSFRDQFRNEQKADIKIAPTAVSISFADEKSFSGFQLSERGQAVVIDPAASFRGTTMEHPSGQKRGCETLILSIDGELFKLDFAPDGNGGIRWTTKNLMSGFASEFITHEPIYRKVKLEVDAEFKIGNERLGYINELILIDPKYAAASQHMDGTKLSVRKFDFDSSAL